MIKFNVKISGTDKGKQEVIDKCKLVLMKSMFKMEELAIDYAPVDQGLLRNKITLFPQILNNHYVLNSGASYSAAMEYGSRPYYAPIQPLKDWARRKFGDEKIGYAVQAKIAKSGIKSSPYMRPALNMTKNFFLPQYMKEVFNR